MASLVAFKFETADGAQQGLALAESLKKQQLIDVRHTATVTWPPGHRKPKTRDLEKIATTGAFDDAFWAILFGLVLFVPVFGLAVGVVFGVMTVHRAFCGTSNELVKQVRQKITEGKSALFLLVGQTTTDGLVVAFKTLPPFEIISTNLSREEEQELKDEFESAA